MNHWNCIQKKSHPINIFPMSLRMQIRVFHVCVCCVASNLFTIVNISIDLYVWSDTTWTNFCVQTYSLLFKLKRVKNVVCVWQKCSQKSNTIHTLQSQASNRNEVIMKSFLLFFVSSPFLFDSLSFARGVLLLFSKWVKQRKKARRRRRRRSETKIVIIHMLRIVSCWIEAHEVDIFFECTRKHRAQTDTAEDIGSSWQKHWATLANEKRKTMANLKMLTATQQPKAINSL